MGTYSIHISKEEAKLLSEIKNLKKNKQDIQLKQEELKLLRTNQSTSGTDGAVTVLFKSYEGYINSAVGSLNSKNLNVVAVFYLRSDNTCWVPWIVSTHLTNAEAISAFGTIGNLEAQSCEFYEAGWVTNDDSDVYPEDFDAEETIFQNLGISTNKGYFQGGDFIMEKPEDILNGQKLYVITESQQEEDAVIKGIIYWRINDVSLWFVFLSVLLILVLVAILFRSLKYSR